MSKRREIRRLAMQLLYQIDLRGEEDLDAITESLSESLFSSKVSEPALRLATGAWRQRVKADVIVQVLAPDWPTHRQPPVDRAILRLAHHEIVTGIVPAKIAINEAVDLAKTFGAENSPSFVNGVLDKMAKRMISHRPPGTGQQRLGSPCGPAETQ